MRELSDVELQAMQQQVRSEMIHRQECEGNWARLFFSSLSAVDLQRADAEIRYESCERVEMLRRLVSQSQSVARRSRTKPRRDATRQSE